MTDFAPLLSASCDDITKLRYPLLASPKLDGIRCVKLNGKALTRKLKPVPNHFVRNWIEQNLPDGIDGELMLRDRSLPFEKVSSAIMSHDGEPDFVFMAFDYFHECESGYHFHDRLSILQEFDFAFGVPERLLIVPHVLCQTPNELFSMMERNLAEGYEGTMVRDPNGRYKFGRSTLKEGILVKIKPFVDDDARVIGVVEQMHNANEATKDNLGRTKRSSAKAGKVPAGTMGALKCVMDDGTEFEVGTGFTADQRLELWRMHTQMTNSNYLGPAGRRLKFKHLPPPGGRPAGKPPRHPVFLCWRED